MKALILAAGYGTRLQAVAQNTPKPLLPIGPQPLINYTVDKVAAVEGLTEIVVVTNNKFFSVFSNWAEAFKHLPVNVRILNDGTNTPEERLGSVGDIKFAWDKETTRENWLVIGGDNLFTEDLRQYMKLAHAQNPSNVTIGVYDIKDLKQASQMGVIKLNAQDQVTEFQEKPAKPESSLIAMCLYYFPSQTLGYIQEYVKAQNSTDTSGGYIQWLTAKKCVYGFQFEGKWYDIGSIESLEEARRQFKNTLTNNQKGR